MRKTLKISWLVDHVNRMNKASTSSPATREGWNGLLETVLMDAGQYAGFRYLDATEVPNGEKPGIHRPISLHGEMVDPIFPDDTRRQYGMKKG